MSNTTNKNTFIGIILCIIGCICLSFMGTFVKLLDNHANEAFILFSRFFISMLMALPFALKEKKTGISITHWKLLFIRSLFGLGAMACFFYAIRTLPLADATLLVNTAPAFVPIVLLLFFKVKTRALVYAGIFISLLGVACVMRPGSGMFHLPALIGSLGGVGAAVATVCLRRMMTVGQNGPSTTLFYYFVITSIIALCFSFYDWVTPHGIQWLYLFLIGIFGGAFQFALTYATRFAQIRVVSPTMLLTVIFSGLIDWQLWGQVPSVLSMVGALLVLIGISIVVRTNR